MMRTDELSGSSWQSFLLELFFFKFLFVYYVKSTNAAKNYFHLEKACLKLLLEYCPWQILIKRATWIFNPIKKNHCFNLPLPRFSPEVFPLKPHWIQTVPRNQRNKKKTILRQILFRSLVFPWNWGRGKFIKNYDREQIKLFNCIFLFCTKVWGTRRSSARKKNSFRNDFTTSAPLLGDTRMAWAPRDEGGQNLYGKLLLIKRVNTLESFHIDPETGRFSGER